MNTHPVYLGKSLCTVFGTSNLILFFAVHIPRKKPTITTNVLFTASSNIISNQ